MLERVWVNTDGLKEELRRLEGRCRTNPEHRIMGMSQPIRPEDVATKDAPSRRDTSGMRVNGERGEKNFPTLRILIL